MLNKELTKYFSKLETPFYYYDLDLLRESLDRLKKSADKYSYNVHYALKANANNRILQIIREYGFGADCVSGNEVLKAVELNFPSEKIVFAGVGKNDREIEDAIDSSIFGFNSESIEEIEIINEIAAEKNKIVSVSFRLNPDIDAVTHSYLTTGLNENKFGIPLSFLDEILYKVKSLANIKVIGLHFHIGSQILDLGPYVNLCKKVNLIQDNIFEKYGIVFEHINLGGGLGINYDNPDAELIPDYEKFFLTINKHLEVKPGQKIHFELGRSVVGQSGSLISRVLYVKKSVNKKFVILDAGMTDLIRPALYSAHHKIQNLSKTGIKTGDLKYDIVGPVCESSDSFDDNVNLPETERGDFIAIRSAGAYGEIMVSQYNLRNKPKTVYSDNVIEQMKFVESLNQYQK